MNGLTGMPGVRLCSARSPERRSGIVNFSAAGAEAGEWVRRLRRAGVVAIQRGGGIRLSPHFYQHGEDIERLLAAIREVLEKSQ